MPKAPKLIPVDLSKVENCDHPDISTRKNYLAVIYGGYFSGKFSREWYGLSFNNWGTSGIQLDSMVDGLDRKAITAIWEIKK